MGIRREEALECFRSDDLIGIGMEADAVRRRLHPEGVVSYAVERVVDLRSVVEGEAGWDLVCGWVGEAVEMGGTGVLLEGVSGERGMDWLVGLLGEVKRRHPGVWVEGLSAAEVVEVAKVLG